MPNWAYTLYIVKGGGEEVEALHRVIRELDEREESLIPNDFGKLWAGNLVHVLGGDWEPDMGIFTTNDTEHVVFHDRWILDWEDETRNLYVHEYFPDIQSVAAFLKEQSIVPMDTAPTEDAIREALESIWNARPDSVAYELKEVEGR